MSKLLSISSDLLLPIDFVTWTQAILATKGMGKSHLADVEAEELLAHGQQIVIIDPTDAHWGLRSSADGKSDGYPITIFGGDHGDLKLEPDAGAVIADAVIAERFSCVICTEGLNEVQEVKVVRDFLERLYRKNRHPIHVFVDEADMFAPETPDHREHVDSTRALRSVVRRGRKKGIGCTMITQRPAELKKSVLSMCELLMVLGMDGPLDIEQVDRLVRSKKNVELARELVESLPDLPQGDAWAWARRRKIQQRFRAREKHTFDSGATPKPGQKVRTAKRLAPVDLARLGAAIAETVQRQKADDPKALRARVAELERELAKKGEIKLTKPVEVIVEKTVPNKAVVVGLERAIAGFDKRLAQRQTEDEKLRVAVNELIGVLRAAVAPVASAPVASRFSPPKPAPTPRPEPASSRAHKPVDGSATVGGGGLRRILTALAQRPAGLTNRQIGVRAGLSSQSGTFSNYLSTARKNGWLEDRGDVRVITHAGVAALGDYEPLPTGRELGKHWLRELKQSGAARILAVLIDAYPSALDNATIGERANISPASGTFSNYMSKLRGLELISGGRGATTASEELF